MILFMILKNVRFFLSVGVAMTDYGSKVINTSGENSGDIDGEFYLFIASSVLIFVKRYLRASNTFLIFEVFIKAYK